MGNQILFTSIKARQDTLKCYLYKILSTYFSTYFRWLTNETTAGRNNGAVDSTDEQGSFLGRTNLQMNLSKSVLGLDVLDSAT